MGASRQIYSTTGSLLPIGNNICWALDAAAQRIEAKQRKEIRSVAFLLSCRLHMDLVALRGGKRGASFLHLP